MRQLISNIWEVTMKMCSNVHNLFWSNLQYLHNSYCATLPHNKFGCSILMQTTTYTWKIAIVQFSSLTTGFKKLCIWLWLLTINKSPHSNLAYNTQQKYEKHRTIDYQVQVNSYNYPNITPVLLTHSEKCDDDVWANSKGIQNTLPGATFAGCGCDVTECFLNK